MKHFVVRTLALLFIAFSFSAFAQTLNINQYGIEEGIPQSTVYTLLQDKSGNIWMGTLGGGVARYNGISFETFNKKNGLAEDRVLSSLLDRNGNIWFGHYAGSITKYHTATKKFHEVLPQKIPFYKNINCILEDKDGSIFFGSTGLGILKYTPSAAELSGEKSDEESGAYTNIRKQDGLSSDIVTAMVQDKTGAIWIATDNGLNKLNANGKVEAISLSGLNSNLISSLTIDTKTNLWIGTNDKGVYRMDAGSASLKNYSTKDGLSSNNIHLVFEDASGNIFIGTSGGGVCKYLPSLEANHYDGPIFQVISTVQGLSNDKVLSMIQDREKNIWIGTYLYLNQYFDEQFEIYGINEGLENSLVWSVYQDKAGDFWLGTEGGLFKFMPKANSNQTAFTRYTDHTKGEVVNTTSIFEDKEGYIWFSEFGQGVSRMDPKSKKITTYTKKDGLLSNDVYTIAADKNGNIWIGMKDGGAARFDYNTKKFEIFTQSNGLGSNSVYSIFNDSKGRLWLGCNKGPLTMYDGSSFKTFKSESGYTSIFTTCITEDQEGNIWFGSFDKGLFKYDGSKFTNYTEAEGLTSDKLFMLIYDGKNNLWIGSGLGIDKFSLKDQTFKHYSKQDGFLGVEINPNAACRDKEGSLWFGSIIGVVKYNSRFEKNNQAEPIIYMKNPRLFYEETEIPADHNFSYNKNHFTFDFVGASLTNPKRVRYQYMLEGFDKDFCAPVKQNFATYPNIPPGTYTFKVKACNNDGVWNQVPAEFTFTINPPFYKTWWFITLCVLVIAASVLAYIRYREQALQKRNKELEDTVTARTAEINLQKEELSRKNANITDSIDYAKRIQEAVFIPLEHVKQMLPDSFVLFRPKDIVSGDFYWAAEKNGKKLFAAVDCTGHGVPGAFMSIIGNNLLNTIVLEQGIVDPAAILDNLNKLIAENLNHNVEGSKVKDGMDIALCAFDQRTNTIEYAGAYNPLYHIHNGELIEIKADKLPVGKSGFHEEQKFTTNTIKVEKGDLIYLFSDGYADQIGGPKRKKFYYGAFKQLLLDNHKLGLEQQKQKLDSTMNEWLGSREQVDDILVFGVKF